MEVSFSQPLIGQSKEIFIKQEVSPSHGKIIHIKQTPVTTNPVSTQKQSSAAEDIIEELVRDKQI